MKRLSTSLLIFILALLAVPDRAWAWSDLRLRSSIYDNWNTSYLSGKTDETSFNKVDNDVNKWTKTIDATSIKEDIYFRLYTTDDRGKEVQPSEDNTDITNKGVYSSAEFVNGKGTKSFRLLQSTNHYDTYTIDAEYTDNKWNITVKATKGGSSDPESKYILMKGDGTNEGSPVATFTGAGFPYTATYNITVAGTYYFYVNDGAKNYFNTNQEINTDGGFATIYQYNDNYFNHVVKLIAPRAGEYTFKFDHVADTKYTLQCNFPSDTETKYTVNISAGEGGSVSPSGDKQIGSTPVEVTATPTENSDYVFDKWIASKGVKVADESSAKTTVTATQPGTLTATFKDTRTPDPTPTPILGNNFYLVGNLFDNETSINYDTRYFKFTDNGDNTYSLDIPATLTVNAQILSVNGSTEKVYGPSTGQNGLSVSGETLSDNGQITDALSEGSKTPTYFWNFQDRTLAHDGIYTITITLNSEGVPGSWTIKHDKTRRVAYYLSNSDGSTAQAAYAVKKADGSSDNKFFGSVFLSKGTGCYVISNMTKNADNSNHSLLETTTKFYLQGNKSGESPAKGQDDNTKVYPVKYDGSATIYKPFVFSSDQDLQLLLEYNPSKGHDGTATQYGGIGGEVLRADYADASGVSLPDITSMKIVGPAVNNSWNLDDAVPMTYNDADNCWEAIINTSAKAGEKFRFVANNKWENSWQENGTEATDKAKIPYNKAGDGHAATTADPNEVSYIKNLTSEESRDENYDIIFNRDHGTWRVRFYIETQSTEGGNKYNYVFKYTINGYKSVLRTYCSDRNEKPTDESIKIYGAYAFEGNETKNSGTIKLYEMNYIPANEGVILYSANVIDEATIAAYTPPAGETKYKNIPDTEDQYHNYLVGKLEDTPVNASEFDGNNVRTHRNFFFNYFSKSGCYTDGATDYLGFFRIKTGKSTCKANHAYLSLPTNVLAWNGQTFGQVMEKYEATGEQHAELTKGMRIVFSDGSDWVEDVPTSITTIKDKNRVFDNYYYTLQGVRVEKPLKGIYIHNGKKVVIK